MGPNIAADAIANLRSQIEAAEKLLAEVSDPRGCYGALLELNKRALEAYERRQAADANLGVTALLPFKPVGPA